MNTCFKVFASYNNLQNLCDLIHVLIFVIVSKCQKKSPNMDIVLTNIVIQHGNLLSIEWTFSKSICTYIVRFHSVGFNTCSSSTKYATLLQTLRTPRIILVLGKDREMSHMVTIAMNWVIAKSSFWGCWSRDVKVTSEYLFPLQILV